MARRRIDLRAAFLAAAGLGWSMSAFAQTKAADTNETIVVTGKSLEETQPQELSGLGHDLVTVDATAIRNAGAVDLTAALQSVPGLYIRSQSGPFSYADLSLQGSRSQDVLWTWDGIRLNNRLYGTTLPTDTLPASMIERIEVLKGGESLFYGTQAAGGVINVVTRGFSNTFDGQLNASVDTFGGNAVDGFARGAIGDHRFVAYATHNQSPGFQPFSRMEPSATDRNRGYDLWSAGLKYQFELAPDLTLNAFWQHTEGKIDNLSATRVNESRNDRNEEIGSVWLDYTRNDTVQLFLKGYFHDWKTAYVQILNPVPAGPPITVYPSGTFWGSRDYGGTAMIISASAGATTCCGLHRPMSRCMLASSSFAPMTNCRRTVGWPQACATTRAGVRKRRCGTHRAVTTSPTRCTSRPMGAPRSCCPTRPSSTASILAAKSAIRA